MTDGRTDGQTYMVQHLVRPSVKGRLITVLNLVQRIRSKRTLTRLELSPIHAMIGMPRKLMTCSRYSVEDGLSFWNSRYRTTLA